ncbi:MAG: hypothetical protein A3A28_05740 [Candidatus Sungbacteria bacterium RIFCSPLOWO2_01_FULL_47_32]|nr:MAG: hypothetical protein A3A28_05740 [Candidatus Sungbacteria bacterium RIFCSPLOWO2_01_FULL_47_32]
MRNALREFAEGYKTSCGAFGWVAGTLIYICLSVIILYWTIELVVLGSLGGVLVLLKKAAGAILGLAGFAALINPVGTVAGAILGMAFSGLFFGTTIFQFGLLLQIFLLVPYVLLWMALGAYVGGVAGGFCGAGILWCFGKRNFRDD